MSCKHHDGYVCSLGLYGGRPSPGVCRQCSSYEGPPRGLGDVIDTGLQKTGVKKVVRKIVGDCGGCEKRRQWLNENLPLGSPSIIRSGDESQQPDDTL